MVKLFKVNEVAKILRVNVSSVYGLINSGKLKAVQIGSIKVTDDELKKFISSSQLDLKIG